MPDKHVLSPDVMTKTVRPGPPGLAAVTLSRMLARRWSLPRPRNQVTVSRDLQVPMSDGTVLLADHYIPVAVDAPAADLVPTGYEVGLGAENASGLLLPVTG